MTFDIAVVIATFILFIVVILSGKVKIHVAAMMIPVILELTGVLEFRDAWGGLLNSSIVMMASMFVVGAAISKTSIISKMSKALIKPGASDVRIMIGIMIPILFLGCFVNATATMTIMIPLITAICAEQRRPISKFMYPAAMLTQIWAGWIPTGGNAGSYLANNTIVENLGGVGTWDYFTNFIAKAPFVLIGIPLVIFLGVKMAPDLGNIPTLDEGAAAATAASAAAAKRKKGNLTPGQEKFVVAVFALTVIGIVICALTGIDTWYPSTVAALVLVFSGILTDREAISAMGNPIIFITVGTLPLATALSVTGADELMVSAFNTVTAGMSPFMIMVLMYLVCMILTQFITNSAVNNAFKMLAALICVQNGYDSRALMLSTQMGSANCWLFPSAVPAMTMGYEAGGYSVKQHFKQGIIMSIVMFIIFCLYTPTIFPLM